MNDFLLAFLAGGSLAALIEGIREFFEFRRKRKAKREDREEAKKDKTTEISKNLEDFKVNEDKRVNEISKDLADFKKEEEGKSVEIDKRFDALDEHNKVLAEAMKIILLDRIRFLGQYYIRKGEISFDDRRIFHMMHDVYHNGLNGNGDADLIVEEVDELELKQ